MSPTTPLPASPGRREFPQTGDVLDCRELAELERLAAERAGSAVARRLPPYPGPVTDPRISLARIAAMEARAVTEVLPVVPAATLPGPPTQAAAGSAFFAIAALAKYAIAASRMAGSSRA